MLRTALKFLGVPAQIKLMAIPSLCEAEPPSVPKAGPPVPVALPAPVAVPKLPAPAFVEALPNSFPACQQHTPAIWSS